MRFRLRTLLLLVLFASIFLTAAVPSCRWLRSRPGRAADYVGEVADIKRALGEDSLEDLQMWNLYGWEIANLWTAKVPREAIEVLKKPLRLAPVANGRFPPEFWDVPSQISDSPRWWTPKPTDTAEYYMTPSFLPEGSTVPNGRDAAVMYDPENRRVWVWSHFDF